MKKEQQMSYSFCYSSRSIVRQSFIAEWEAMNQRTMFNAFYFISLWYHKRTWPNRTIVWSNDRTIKWFGISQCLCLLFSLLSHQLSSLLRFGFSLRFIRSDCRRYRGLNKFSTNKQTNTMIKKNLFYLLRVRVLSMRFYVLNA